MGAEDTFSAVAAKMETAAPEAAPAGRDQAPSTSGAPESNNSILDLDRVEKFKIDGQEMSLKDLKNAMLRQQDYTRKTQEVARERELYKARESEQKFVDNLDSDLENVRNNPNLADQFRQLYPEKFHKYLNFVVQKAQQEQGNQTQDPQFNSMKQEFNQIKEYLTTQRVEAAEAQIEAMVSKYAPKYPLADTEVVLGRAIKAHEAGVKLTPESWENIYKTAHEKIEKISNDFQQTKVKEQQSANKKGRDAGVGGAPPGAAPKKRTFDEATADAIASLGGRH